jgi:putative transposase
MTITESLLQIGARCTISAHPYEVAHVGESSIRLSSEFGGNQRNLDFETINELIDQNDIEITYTPPTLNDGIFSALTEKQVATLNRKLNYVKGVCGAHDNARSQDAIADTIRVIAEEIGDEKPPSTSSVASWVKRWIDGGYDRSVFLPKLKPSRSSILCESPDLLEIIRESVNSVYLNRQKNPQSLVMSEIKIRIAGYNALHATPLPVPSKETLRRYINTLDEYEVVKQRFGKHYANRKFRAAGISFVAQEPMELVMADGQLMDVIVIKELEDGRFEEIGRPYLTSFIDIRSRCILGHHISLAPFCGATLLRALSNAVVADGAKPRGIFLKVLIDNGSDYQDSGFLRACAKLNIIVEPTKPRDPNAKAIKERWFKTLNTGLIHRLEGTTFSNPMDRGDYDSQDMARLTIEDLRAHVATWIDHVYHEDVHRTLERAPINVWKDEAPECHIDTLTQKDADILLRDEVERTLTQGVVEAHGLQWKCPALTTWEQTKRRLNQERKVSVRIDELDLSKVYILTPDRSEPHIAYSRRPTYTQNLSLYEHKQIKEFTKQKRINDRLERLGDKELYKLRLEYKASLGHADHKIALRALERLRDYGNKDLPESNEQNSADESPNNSAPEPTPGNNESREPAKGRRDESKSPPQKEDKEATTGSKPQSNFPISIVKKRNPL